MELEYLNWTKCPAYYDRVFSFMMGGPPPACPSERTNGLDFMLSTLVRNSSVSHLSAASNLMAQLCIANNFITINTVIRGIVKLERNWDFVPVAPFSGNTSSVRELKYYWVGQLRGFIRYLLEKNQYFLPPMLRKTALYLWFLGPTNISLGEYIRNVITYQREYPGMAAAVPVKKWRQSLQLGGVISELDAMAAEAGQTVATWGIRLLCDDTTDVLIDGENVELGNFESQLDQVFSYHSGGKIRYRFYDSENSEQRYARYLSNCPESQVVLVPRAVNGKSQVDFAIRDYVSKAYYQEGIKEFCIVSSDADFYSLIDVYTDARFSFVFARSMVSKNLVSSLIHRHLPFTYIDESLAIWNRVACKIKNLVFECQRKECEGNFNDDVFADICREMKILPNSYVAESALQVLKESH